MRFSIIIPTYNRSGFVASAIQSVLFQSYPNFEIIVVDDGSIDNTEQIVGYFTDKRVHYYKKDHQERAAARNFGVLKAKGDYITFLDSDDIIYPHYLSEALLLIEKYNNSEWFHLKYEIKNTSNKTIWRSTLNTDINLNKELLMGNFLSCIGVFLRKDIAKKNSFNTTLELSGSEDHELWLRMASQYLLKQNNSVAAALIDHNGRSVLKADNESIIRRRNLFLELVLSNPKLKGFISGYENKIKSNSYSYIALHIALTGKHKKVCLIYLMKSLQQNVNMIFNWRFFAIIKHLLLTK